MTIDHTPDEALAARLRQLPSQRTPPPQVWEAIASGIAPTARTGQPATPAITSTPRRRRHWRTPVGWALAASVALLAWVLVPTQVLTPSPTPSHSVAAAPLLVQQADAMAGQYHQAIATVPVSQVPTDLQPALHELDASAAAIRLALQRQPDADFLLNQLQRTYAKRLELTRMAALVAMADTTT
ncbi:MAG TPA: hypothetical protein VGC74_14155 [Stenotrophomonas sp.]|jgi:hypothetical protein